MKKPRKLKAKKTVKSQAVKKVVSKALKSSAKRKSERMALNPSADVSVLIKQIRIGSTMSEKTLAIMTGIGVFRIQDLEAGKSIPTLGELLEIARVFGKEGLVLIRRKK